jgi:hypothetical protein
VCFPTGVVYQDRVIGQIAYIASRNKLITYHYETSELTADGYVVYGATSGDDRPFPATGCNIYVAPVLVFRSKVHLYPAPPPVGHSADLAIALSALYPSRLPTPHVIFTGQVFGDAVGPVALVPFKSKLAKFGFRIAGAVDEYGYVLRDIHQALAFAIDAGKFVMSSKTK